jgi:hypothetical protein
MSISEPSHGKGAYVSTKQAQAAIDRSLGSAEGPHTAPGTPPLGRSHVQNQAPVTCTGVVQCADKRFRGRDAREWQEIEQVRVTIRARP